MRLLFGILLSTIFTVISINCVSKRDIFHSIIEREIIKFIDTLDYDEMISILEIIRYNITPSSSLYVFADQILTIKLNTFFDILEQLYKEKQNILDFYDIDLDDDEEMDFDNSADEELVFLVHKFYSAIYNKAREIVSQMPYDQYSQIMFLKQLSPDIVKTQFKYANYNGTLLF